MMYGLHENIIVQIKNVLSKYEDINKAVIFGSRARGDFRYNSDIDIVIYAEGKVSSRIWLELDEAAGIYKIDIVDMNSPINEELRKRIEEQGIEIYAK
ncbi:nucleotidyltransferase [Vulcanibacillus modesticaldus]|uniref:Nucleotidyltransferase n=1 Tax=Vulcanibacillus modesticaldus TaxID=337097 RepID=A0A1D2YTU7_9BACI|nr:nucleotidyltransferase domain-containing protein [Vulcanibacillus modesticaldus]OEF99130.1 nucleotidyltransferase [Vulcanibacillus modesticaldus]